MLGPVSGLLQRLAVAQLDNRVAYLVGLVREPIDENFHHRPTIVGIDDTIDALVIRVVVDDGQESSQSEITKARVSVATRHDGAQAQSDSIEEKVTFHAQSKPSRVHDLNITTQTLAFFVFMLNTTSVSFDYLRVRGHGVQSERDGAQGKIEMRVGDNFELKLKVVESRDR